MATMPEDYSPRCCAPPSARTRHDGSGAGWRVPDRLEPVSPDEAAALRAWRDAAPARHLPLEYSNDVHVLRLTGDASAQPALAALHAIRNPPPPEPTVAEAVIKYHPRLVPGRRYRIDFDDCCVQGHLHAVYLAPVEYPADEGGGLCGYRFDIGVLEPAWGTFSFTEAPEGDG